MRRRAGGVRRGARAAARIATAGAAAWIAATLVTGCDRRAHVTSCDANLDGAWRTTDGARWMILDHGQTLEAYPLFDDAAGEAAPRVIDLRRAEQLAGEVRRRHTRGGEHCEGRAAVRVTACEHGTLQLVLASPPAPLAYAPCQWPATDPPHIERWRRE